MLNFPVLLWHRQTLHSWAVLSKFHHLSADWKESPVKEDEFALWEFMMCMCYVCKSILSPQRADSNEWCHSARMSCSDLIQQNSKPAVRVFMVLENRACTKLRARWMEGNFPLPGEQHPKRNCWALQNLPAIYTGWLVDWFWVVKH